MPRFSLRDSRAVGLLCLSSLPSLALASTPATQTATVPSKAGDAPVVLTWTGTLQPGASGASGSCKMAPTDDGHTVALTVPAGLYAGGSSVTADFNVTFPKGSLPGGTGSDPDLVLSVYNGSTDVGDSDTGGDENVRVTNPTGTLNAVVCPFAATKATEYKATLTLTYVAAKACVTLPTGANANSMSLVEPSTGLAGTFLGLTDGAVGTPNFDLFRQSTWTRAGAVPAAGYSGRLQPAIFDRALGVPTFLWASNAATATGVGPLATPQAVLAAKGRAQLRAEAKRLKLDDATIDNASVEHAQYNGAGPAVVRFRQRVNGYEVYQRYLNVLIDMDGKPVATSGYFASGYGTPSSQFALSAPQAVAKAWGLLGGTLDPLSLVLKANQGEYQWWSLKTALAGTHAFEREPRTRAIYYAADGQLIPAYYVELFSVAKVNRNLSAYAVVVSAVDGTLLSRDNLKAADAGSTSKPFAYRMYADTAPPYMILDQPLGNGYTPFPSLDPMATIARVANPSGPSLVSLANGPISTKDSWLVDTATQTIGNNVAACADKFDPANGTLSTPYNTCDDPLSTTMGDFYAKPSGDHAFDYTAAPDKDPSTAAAQSGAVVSLFYLNNWLHDWWYDHGFDEKSGNAQTNNYNRGGTAADPIRAQAQDGSGRNNANMATPADGSSPTMQQYLFNGVIKGVVDVKDTLNLGSIPFNGVEFGPQTFDYTGDAAIGNDGCTGLATPAGPSLPVVGSPTVPVPVPTPDPNLMGKIAVIVRGTCAGSYKVRWAVESGATGVVLVNNVDGPPPYLVNGDVPVRVLPVQPTNMVYQIPVVTVRNDDGKKIMDALTAGKKVSMHLQRLATIDLDGTLDNQIVGHEFFHYVHHRLTASSNQQANAMSEGWGDIDAMMISVRADDTMAVDNDHWQGAYGLAGYVVNNFYNGIRRAPYSTDAKKNAFTLKHISNGVMTPDGGPGTTNSEVHAAGEIWANEMWNCYAGILNTPGNGSFLQKQSRMQDYIIGGLKMTPANATYTEARDAILATVLAGKNNADYRACSNGFAARGNGLNAVAPARDSTDLTGAKDDFTAFVCPESATTPPTTGGGTTPTTGGGATPTPTSGGTTSPMPTPTSGGTTSPMPTPTSGGTTPSPGTPTSGTPTTGANPPDTGVSPVGATVTESAGRDGSGRGGAGALGWLVLLPLSAGALRRRKVRVAA